MRNLARLYSKHSSKDLIFW